MAKKTARATSQTPTISTGATNFQKLHLALLSSSELPPIYNTCTQIRQKIRNFIENKDSAPHDANQGEVTKDEQPKLWTIAAFRDAI